MSHKIPDTSQTNRIDASLNSHPSYSNRSSNGNADAIAVAHKLGRHPFTPTSHAPAYNGGAPTLLTGHDGVPSQSRYPFVNPHPGANRNGEPRLGYRGARASITEGYQGGSWTPFMDPQDRSHVNHVHPHEMGNVDPRHTMTGEPYMGYNYPRNAPMGGRAMGYQQDPEAYRLQSEYNRHNNFDRSRDLYSYPRRDARHQYENYPPSNYPSYDSYCYNLGSNLAEINWQVQNIIPIRKNFYQEHPSVTRLTSLEVDQIRNEASIVIVQGDNVPKPVRTFEEACLPEAILNRIDAAKFEKPTGIQIQSLPVAMSGRDFIGIAETGSGKTLAYLLPGIVHLNAQPPLAPGDGPMIVILAPTRELALQIHKEATFFTRGFPHMRSHCCYGGVPRGSQIPALRNGVEILIATPGRLIDFLEMNITNLMRATYLVIDEADRMLNMGFEPQMRKIISQIRPGKQTLMFSATWPEELKRLSQDTFGYSDSNLVHINVGKCGHVPENINQHVEVIEDSQKLNRLVQVITDLSIAGDKSSPSLDTVRGNPPYRILVFTDTKKSADYVSTILRRAGIQSIALHGDKKQTERESVLQSFRSGIYTVLVATDVVSRGLDVKDIRCVINYSFPNTVADYIHRIGRTGRAGNSGIAYTFLSRDRAKQCGSKMLSEFVTVLTDAGQQLSKGLLDLLSEFTRDAHHDRHPLRRHYN